MLMAFFTFLMDDASCSLAYRQVSVTSDGKNHQIERSNSRICGSSGGFSRGRGNLRIYGVC